MSGQIHGETSTLPDKRGLLKNWKQFLLLVIINGFVGGMVGLERTILPELAEQEFEIAAASGILSFIIVFGISKALANFVAGAMANRFGRKRLLVWGWLIAIPVPLILMWAPAWEWIILANIFLGVNQGLAWSSTVVMKIDLVTEKERGLAMGLNESAGYLAVALMAFVSGWIATEYGLRPYPFYLGIVLVVLGLILSVFWVKDTFSLVQGEASTAVNQQISRQVFLDTSFKDKNLSSVTQAGMVNNLNDGMMWGLLPIMLAGKGFGLDTIGIIVGIYPAVWGLGQIFTGRLADFFKKKKLLFWGMFLQGLVLFLIAIASVGWQFCLLAALLGLGTAMVYPTFLAAIADFTHPLQRAHSIGIFRLWRDLGYAFGAILSGLVADYFGIGAAILLIGGITIVSGFVVLFRMR